ncbi:MAG: uncharacterized protein QG661_168 [Actinomycetota bacterium]|jgi:PPOX class probable F420-dependent enzyme|nr:uncharacterized protein [Actinomycetota bacterium]
MDATRLDTLSRAKYISLTTFRADGSAVPTPVWLVRSGDALRVLTDASSGKVRRLKADSAVLVAPCDMRGRVKPGVVPVPARATLQDEAETAETMALITARYGLMGRILGWLNARRARKAAGGTLQHVGLTITLA